MTLGFGFRCRLARPWVLAALLIVCGLAPASATARSGPPADLTLSPRLADLAEPEVRSLPPAEQAEQLGLAASGPGSLLRLDGRVLVDARFSAGAIAALGALRAAGAEVIAPSRRYQTVTVAIAPARLRQLAAVEGVEGVSEKRAPLIFGDGESSAAAIGAQCEGGAVISEGVGQLDVAAARSKHDVDGSGVTVGVLSDSYDQASLAGDESGPVATHASEDVESSDLSGPANPCAGEKAPVNVLEDFESSGFEPSDEGRAMLQIVHDVAPGASLAFATAFLSELSFAQNIERLAKPVAEGGAGADVIVDDVVWFEEPFFQDGPVAAAVDKVVGEGAAYFSAAGNNNLFDSGGNEIASWEAPGFRNSETCPPAVLALLPPATGHCMDFDPGAETDTTFAITVSPGATLSLDLQWAEPWFGVETDLDAYLLDAGGNPIAGEEADNVVDTQRPVEVLQWENASGFSRQVRLVVNRCAGECNPAAGETGIPPVKFALLQNGSGVTKTEYPVSAEGDVVGPTIFGHAGAAGAVAAAAVPFNDSEQVEKYSSRGPVTHHFEPVLDEDPAEPLAAPETIAKPDIAATDCGETTFFSFLDGAGAWRFCGTSAAAPHAAAVAALQLEAEPAASVEAVRGAQTSTAIPVGAFGPTAAGAGLLDADSAIAALLPPAAVTIVEHPSSRTADSTPTFGFESSPPAAEFTCSVDEGSPQPCISPYTVPSPLADGAHRFEVNGVDVAGSASFSFTVDTSPPEIAFGQRPPPISSLATPIFEFSAGEPATLACAVDGVAPLPCKSPFAVTKALPDGAHSFLVTATDQVGNSSQATVDFVVDTTAPSLTLLERPAEKSNNRTPAFAFAAGEPVAFVCSVDAVLSQACASPFVAPLPLADGSHGFEVVATDPAGNTARASAQFAIDTRSPQTFIRRHPRKVLRARRGGVRVSFRFGSDEPGVEFACKVDRGLPRFCGPRLVRRFGPGRHAIRVRARDEVGNVDRTQAVFRFRVRRVG